MRYWEILEKLDLVPWWAEFVQTNRSNRLPYHNLQHAMYMVEDAYEGALAEGLATTDTHPIIKALIMAAIFHDYGHTGGVFHLAAGSPYPPDSENIAIAVAKVSSLLRSGFWPSGVSLDMVIASIKATEYPYTESPENITPSGRILRDADLLTSAKITFVPHVIYGLSEEMGYPLKTLAQGEKIFLMKVVMTTEWGRTHWAVELPRIIEELDFFSQTLATDPPR